MSDSITRRSMIVAIGACLLASSIDLKAAETSTKTVMTVGEMCGGCVKKIKKKLEPMDGIDNVDCSREDNTVTVTPEDGVVLSPRKLWEAMEEIGKTPKKLVGPSGTFTSKPTE